MTTPCTCWRTADGLAGATRESAATELRDQLRKLPNAAAVRGLAETVAGEGEVQPGLASGVTVALRVADVDGPPQTVPLRAGRSNMPTLPCPERPWQSHPVNATQATEAQEEVEVPLQAVADQVEGIRAGQALHARGHSFVERLRRAPLSPRAHAARRAGTSHRPSGRAPAAGSRSSAESDCRRPSGSRAR